MKRFMISNINQENLQSSSELKSFVREYDHNNLSSKNDSEKVIV